MKPLLTETRYFDTTLKEERVLNKSHNDAEKKNLFQKNNLKLLSSFKLDEDVWRNDYYCCLEKSIKNRDDELLFEKEINKIIEFKKNPKSCRSIYYILKKLD